MLKIFATIRFLSLVLLSLCLAKGSWCMDKPDDHNPSESMMSKLSSAFFSTLAWVNDPYGASSAFTESEIENHIKDMSSNIYDLSYSAINSENHKRVINGIYLKKLDDSEDQKIGRWQTENNAFIDIFVADYVLKRTANPTKRDIFCWTPRFPLNLTREDLKSFQTLTERFENTDDNSWVVGSPISLNHYIITMKQVEDFWLLKQMLPLDIVKFCMLSKYLIDCPSSISQDLFSILCLSAIKDAYELLFEDYSNIPPSIGTTCKRFLRTIQLPG